MSEIIKDVLSDLVKPTDTVGDKTEMDQRELQVDRNMQDHGSPVDRSGAGGGGDDRGGEDRGGEDRGGERD